MRGLQDFFQFHDALAQTLDLDRDRVRQRLLEFFDLLGPDDPRVPPARRALARALLTGARVYVLDEPTEHLDEPTAERITDDLLAATDGRTVVWGTTDRTEEKAEKLAALLTQPGKV